MSEKIIKLELLLQNIMLKQKEDNKARTFAQKHNVKKEMILILILMILILKILI